MDNAATMATQRIDKVLVANRGEIAIRIMRTCRTMGIATVAVFSDADRQAPHVEFADEAVHVGPAPAAESYLAIERIIAAARLTGADAIHPGYGFLAENWLFAQAVVTAGLTFIGPTPEVIQTLGSKREAKRIAQAAGVPVLPGGDLDEFDAASPAVDFPLLIKASAGGGGKGMRIVRAPGEFAAAVESARREAQKAFGDDTLLVEKYLERPRHIEVQILGDSHGNVIDLYERECSIQRRHQKIIEETPAPVITADLRQRMAQAAVAVGRTVGYRNAGTVEFLLDSEGNFYFLEVNTRLQVEHPITECVTGIDLVREQIRIARGESVDRAAIVQYGAAIECRLYAEDPARGFLPTSGPLIDWYIPPALLVSPGVRVDSGVTTGQEIGIDYDPLLAKLVCHAPTRDEAIQKMHHLLRNLSVQGVTTNREFLITVLDHEAFRLGRIDTHFIEQHGSALGLTPDGHTESTLAQTTVDAVIAALVADHERRRARQTVLPHLPPGFRNNHFADEHVEYREDTGQIVRVSYRSLGAGRLHVSEPLATDIEVISFRDPELVLESSHGSDATAVRQRQRFRVIASDDRVYVFSQGTARALRELPRFPGPLDEHSTRLEHRGREALENDAAIRTTASSGHVAGGLRAPMPGRVVRVLVSRGQRIAAGDIVAILEAMKMEHALKAPEAGSVVEIAVHEGDLVPIDALIAVVSADSG